MARPATGREFVKAAKERIASAKTVEALRAAQALLLPLEFGLSLEETATVIGLSKSRTGKLRTQFQRIETGALQIRSKKELRNHARMSLAEEVKFLARFVAEAKDPGTLSIAELKTELERYTGRPVSTSTVYQLLRRHGLSKQVHQRRRDFMPPQAWKDWAGGSTERKEKSN
jgi:transposase